MEESLVRRVYLEVESVLYAGIGSQAVPAQLNSALDTIAEQSTLNSTEDLQALAERDAAAHQDAVYVFESYSSFRAVLAYRVASLVHRAALDASADVRARQMMTCTARRITERAKAETGVDIHPAAVIGRRFVVDHGSGTVVGEQVEMGDDCYILQNVILGGRSIGYSRGAGVSRRHPRIGNRVEIGGGVSVLGPITIGDDCRLGPGAVITRDIPPLSRVQVVSTLQVTVADESPRIHGIALELDDLVLCGTGLTGCLPVLLDHDRLPVRQLSVASSSDTHIRCEMPAQLAPQIVSIGLLACDALVSYITPLHAFWNTAIPAG